MRVIKCDFCGRNEAVYYMGIEHDYLNCPSMHFDICRDCVDKLTAQANKIKEESVKKP